MNSPMKKLNIQVDPDEAVTTGIELPKDMPTYTLSKAHGDNVDGVVFNLKYLEDRDPELAADLRQLAEEASEISPDDLPAHEEDQRMIAEEFKKIAIKTRGDPDQGN